MEEYVEVITEEGYSTGINIFKSVAHKNGICHRISAIGIINSNGELLIQQRSKNKLDEPLKWGLSAAGHVSSEENNILAAIREVKEEIDIDIKENELIQIDVYLNKNIVNDNIFINHLTTLYIIKKDIDISKIQIQKEEVSNIKFINKDTYIKMLNNDEMVKGINYCSKLLDYMK